MKTIDLEEMKKIELKMLEYVDNICRTNNIRYFLLGGSLIGAVRHHGMIPWDDDIDIGLLRHDYNKLLDILKNDKNNQYELFDGSIQSDYYYPFAKLIDKRTILKGEKSKPIKDYGIYIDIFPIDMLPNNKKERNKQYKKLRNSQKRIFYWMAQEIQEKNVLKKLIKKLLKKYCEMVGIERILNRHNKICNKYNDDTSREYTISSWPIYERDREIQKSYLFEELIDCEFDGLTVKISKKYDEMLTNAYGDYMALPPEEERVGRHNTECYWKE